MDRKRVEWVHYRTLIILNSNNTPHIGRVQYGIFSWKPNQQKDFRCIQTKFASLCNFLVWKMMYLRLGLQTYNTAYGLAKTCQNPSILLLVPCPSHSENNHKCFSCKLHTTHDCNVLSTTTSVDYNRLTTFFPKYFVSEVGARAHTYTLTRWGFMYCNNIIFSNNCNFSNFILV